MRVFLRVFKTTNVGVNLQMTAGKVIDFERNNIGEEEKQQNCLQN